MTPMKFKYLQDENTLVEVTNRPNQAIETIKVTCSASALLALAIYLPIFFGTYELNEIQIKWYEFLSGLGFELTTVAYKFM